MAPTQTRWGPCEPASLAEITSIFADGRLGGQAVPWRIEIVLDESDGDDWVSRRDARIRRPLARLGDVTASGVPYLAPEIALYYKAKTMRPKDETDFAVVLPLLSAGQRAWLRDAIGLSHGPDHPWRARLAGHD